jgi:predicted GIY-YIG superfamily endonuclease
MAYYVYLLASRKHGTLYLGVTTISRDADTNTESRAVAASQRDTASTSWSGSKSTTMQSPPSPAKKNSRNGVATGRYA